MKLTPQDLDAIYATTTSDPTEELIDATANEYGLNPALLRAVIQIESSGNPAAVSPKGAQGLMQLMPDTAKRFGVTDPFHPGQNLRGGAQYLKTLIGQFPNQPELVLAAYNAGEGTVAKHGGVPPYPETQAYVKKVMGTLGTQPFTTGRTNGKVTVDDLEALYPSVVTVQDLEGVYGQTAPEPGIFDQIKGIFSGLVSQPEPGQQIPPDLPVESGGPTMGRMPTLTPPPPPDIRTQAVQQAKQDSLGTSAVPVTTPPEITGPVVDLPVESGGPTMGPASPMPFPERLRTMQQSPNVLERLFGGGVAGALAPVEHAFRPPSEGGTADIAARAGEIIFAPISAAISGVVNALVQSGAISQQVADRTLKDLMGATPALMAPEAAAFRAASKFRKGFRENQPAATVPPAWQTPEAQDFLRRVSALRERVVRGATPSEQAAAARLLDDTLKAYGITAADLPAEVTQGLPKPPMVPQVAIPERVGMEPPVSRVAPEPPPQAPPRAPTAPPVQSEVSAATPQPPKVETPTAAPVVAQAESKAAPLGRIEPKSIPVSQPRIQELVDAGVDPARAKAQAVDEATSGRGPKTTLPPEIAKMAEEERAAGVSEPVISEPGRLAEQAAAGEIGRGFPGVVSALGTPETLPRVPVPTGKVNLTEAEQELKQPNILDQIRTKKVKPAPEPIPPENVITVGDTISDGLVHGKVLASGVMRQGKKDVPAWQIEITSGRQKGEKSIITKQDAVKYTPPAERTPVEPTVETPPVAAPVVQAPTEGKRGTQLSLVPPTAKDAKSLEKSILDLSGRLDEAAGTDAETTALYEQAKQQLGHAEHYLTSLPVSALTERRHLKQTVGILRASITDYDIMESQGDLRGKEWRDAARRQELRNALRDQIGNIRDRSWQGRHQELAPPRAPVAEPVPPKPAAPVPITERLRTKTPSVESEIERLRAENARLKGQETPTPSTIEALQKKIKAQEAKINGPRAAMVPPPIRAEQQRYLTKLRDQLDAEIAKQETPNVNPPRTPAGATVPEVPEAVGAAGGRVGGAAGAGEPGSAGPPVRERTTPRLGTPERTTLEADEKAVDDAQSAAYAKVSELRRQRDASSYGTKKREQIDKQLEKAQAASDASDAAAKTYQGENVVNTYHARLEDAAEQTANRLLQLASDAKVRKIRRDTPEYAAIEKGVETEVRRLVDEVKKDPERNSAELSMKDDAETIEKAVSDATEEFMRSPLLASDNANGRVSGILHAVRVERAKVSVRQEIEKAREAGIQRSKWEVDLNNAYDFKRIDEIAAQIRQEVEAHQYAIKTKEEAEVKSDTKARERALNPTESDKVGATLADTLPKGTLEKFHAKLGQAPEGAFESSEAFRRWMDFSKVPSTVQKLVAGMDPKVVKEALEALDSSEGIVRPYVPRPRELTPSDLGTDATRWWVEEKFGDQTKTIPAHGTKGEVKGYGTVWTNGRIVEVGEPPKSLVMDTERVPKIEALLGVPANQVSLVPVARKTGEGQPTFVVLKRSDGVYTAIDQKYYDHLASRHPNAEWGQGPEIGKEGEGLSPVYLQENGKVVGVVMPMRLSPTPAMRALGESVERTTPTATPKRGGASVGPGAQAAEEFTPAAEIVTSTKNAIKNLEREARGLEPTTRPPTFTNQVAWDQALKQIEEDAGLQDRLIAELVLQPRALTPVENGLLLHRSVNLINERNDLATQLFRSVESGFEERTVKLKADLDRISDEMLDLDRVLRSVGTESGRSLQARKMMVDQDYTLLAMETRKRIAKGGAKLSDAERAEIKVLHDRIASLTAQLERQAAIGQAAASAQHATKAVQEMGQRVATETAHATRTGTTRDAGKERSAILDGLERASEEADLADLRPWIQKLAESFVREGITTRDPLVKAVHGVLVDLFPEITLRQTMDAISGFGDFRPLNPDPIKTKLRDLKGQMQQVAKLENLHARQPIPKTGVERRVPSDEERRLIQMVEEAKRRYGVTVTDPERQLKTALDTIKTRLRHEITDLEYQIATKQKFVKTKSPTPTDPETAGLRTQRDTLKAHFDELFGVSEKTPEQRTALAIRAVERSITGLAERIAAKDIAPRHLLSRTPVTPELTALRARQTALREQLQELRDLDTSYQEQQRLRALERSIADYERRVTTGDLAPTATSAGPDTPAIKATTARRDAARNALDALRESSGYSDALRVQRALAALEDGNAELSRKIREHDLAPKAKGKVIPDTPEILRARAEHEALSAVLQEMREAERPRKTPEEIALQTLKTRMAHKAADLAEKLTTGQFQTPPRREILLDLEGKRLRTELDRVMREFHEGLVADRLARRSRSQKVLAGMGEALNIPRLLMTSFDLSAVLRQGGFLAFGHPLLAIKTFPDMFRALWSKAGQHAVMEEILTRPNAALYHKAGLYLSDLTTTLSQMEEAYMSRWATHIPGLASSQRAYVSFLNRLRADAFDTLVRSLRRGDEVTLDEAKAIANYINVATGRGKIGIHSTGAVGLNSIFFSPRYLASRFQLFGGQPFYHGTGRTRKKVATEYGRFLLGAAVVYALAKAAGSEIELDPRSSDFGKIRFGKTRIDPMGGLLQVTTLLSRLVTGETKTLKGKVQPIRGPGVRFGQDDTADLLARFLRTKLSPNLGLSIDVMTGKSVTGEPVTPTSALGRAVVPMALQDIYESLREQGVPKGSAMGVLAIFGMGLSTYEDRQRPRRDVKKPGMVPTLQEILKRPYDRNQRR